MGLLGVRKLGVLVTLVLADGVSCATASAGSQALGSWGFWSWGLGGWGLWRWGIGGIEIVVLGLWGAWARAGGAGMTLTGTQVILGEGA